MENSNQQAAEDGTQTIIGNLLNLLNKYRVRLAIKRMVHNLSRSVITECAADLRGTVSLKKHQEFLMPKYNCPLLMVLLITLLFCSAKYRFYAMNK